MQKSSSMPAKLVVVIALVGLGIVLNLVQQAWLAAALGGLLLFFLARGSNTARFIAIALSVLSLVVISLQSLPDALRLGSLVPLTFWLLYGVAVVQVLFMLWALTRQDVITWMDEREMARLGTSRGRGDEPPKYV